MDYASGPGTCQTTDKGEKYGHIRDVVADYTEGKPVYLDGYLTAAHAIGKFTVEEMADMVERERLERCTRIF